MKPFCDGQTRRDFLRVGSAGLFGMGLGLPQMLAADRVKSPGTKDVSLIFVFLHGGLSTIDTFDLKPDAPAEFRGEFNPIATNLPGYKVCEHLPHVAKVMDHLSVIRSFRHHNSDHGPADHYMLTGYFPTAGFNPNLNPNNQRPSHGSIISKKLGPRGSVPPYVCLPKVHPSFGSAYLGAGSAPFGIDADPNAPGFSVPDILPPMSVAGNRLPYAPRHLVTAGLTARAGSRVQVGLEGVHIGRQETDAANSAVTVADGQQGPIPAATWWNATASLVVPALRSTVYVSGRNLADRVHLVDRSRGLLPGMGRTIQVGITTRF